ncbi:MAG: hypothetical protein ACJ76S_07745 [Solirubrobacteraceae bacterium]
MVSRWFSGLRGGLILGLIALGVVVAVASAKQVTTGHAEIFGKQVNVPVDHRVEIFRHKKFVAVRFLCAGNLADFADLEVTNLENLPIRVTYERSNNGFRVSDEVKPHSDQFVAEGGHIQFTDPDVGIADLSHKYATLNIDWGVRQRGSNSCDVAVNTILHFPDGTPLNADHVPGSARK